MINLCVNYQLHIPLDTCALRSRFNLTLHHNLLHILQEDIDLNDVLPLQLFYALHSPEDELTFSSFQASDLNHLYYHYSSLPQDILLHFCSFPILIVDYHQVSQLLHFQEAKVFHKLLSRFLSFDSHILLFSFFLLF